MGKKKQSPINESDSTLDLKSIIHQNSLFFDKLVELIPAKFYLPLDDKEKPWFQGLSKEEKASTKKESKENVKKARRDRFDPEKSSKTTLDLLKQSLDKENSDTESEDEIIEVRPIMTGMDDDNRSITYEELQQRLRRKIEELRGGRNTGSSDKAKSKNERKGNLQKKRKRDPSSGESSKPASGTSADKVERDAAEAAEELAFGHVKLGNDEKHGWKKRKLSKNKELENALKLEEAKKDPEIAKKHMWKAAMSRAQGNKVHDDPKLLKRKIKKGKKRHDKNVEKWKERFETTEKMKAGRQQTRSENISERIHQKKMRRIAKREKKLLRPGFEGRKEGYINEGSA